MKKEEVISSIPGHIENQRGEEADLLSRDVSDDILIILIEISSKSLIEEERERLL